MKPWILDQLKHIPSLPGVYLFRDGEGEVLYVGKARDLKKRVRQYFAGRRQSRASLFVSRIGSVETIVAGTEKEALLLENTLIKRHRPPFNVNLKDDKGYPLFKVTVSEEFPRFEITRKVQRDGSLYFGPFSDAGAARKTMAWLERAFPLRHCRKPKPGGRGKPGRPCMDFQIGRCPGPCSGDLSPESYRVTVDELIAFLKGGGRKVVRGLEGKMEKASRDLRFEDAAILRDRIRAMEAVLEKQDVVGSREDDLDVIGFSRSEGTGVIVCLFVRSGTLVGRSDMVIRDDPDPSQALEAFLRNHYKEGINVPSKILIPLDIDFAKAHEEVLSALSGRSVRLLKPVRGRGSRLLGLAGENARQALRETLGRDREAGSVSGDLGRMFDLDVPVNRVECVDISHTSGRETYGGLVAWERGRLKKEDYRLFNIRNRNEGDDYAAISEVVERRFTGSIADRMPPPDLLLIDGGKGQLARVAEVIRSRRISLPAVASISKGRSARKKGGSGALDEVFVPGRSNPLAVGRHSQAFHLLQMIRDEAHRFALSSHRNRRSREDLMSRLDGIPGIGPTRRKALLERFRSLQEIRAAGMEEIASIKGFNQSVAKKVKEALS